MTYELLWGHAFSIRVRVSFCQMNSTVGSLQAYRGARPGLPTFTEVEFKWQAVWMLVLLSRYEKSTVEDLLFPCTGNQVRSPATSKPSG